MTEQGLILMLKSSPQALLARKRFYLDNESPDTRDNCDFGCVMILNESVPGSQRSQL